MNIKIYLTFGSLFFLKSENFKNEKKKLLIENFKKNKNTSTNKKSDEEIFFNFLQKLSEKEQKDVLLIIRFISDKKFGLEKMIKAGVAVILSLSEIKLEEIPDKIVLKPVSLSAFLIAFSLQDILTEILNYSASDFKYSFKKSKELRETPQQYKNILEKLFNGDWNQLQYIMPEKHAKRLNNSKNYKKIISALRPYASILIDFTLFAAQNDNYYITDEEIDAINRLLNKKFKGNFYEKIFKIKQTLEAVKQEVQKDDFQDSSHFFDLLFKQLSNQIKSNIDKNLKTKNNMVNTQNFSASEKKEIIQTALEAIYVIVEEIQPNNIEKLIKKTKKMLKN